MGISTNPIPERHNVTSDQFRQEIYPAAQPVVIRGLVRDWPMVRAAQESQDALFSYLQPFDNGQIFEILYGPPEIEGRFFYSDGLSGRNFTRENSTLRTALERLRTGPGTTQYPGTTYIQSVPVPEILPGLKEHNPMPFISSGIDPRLWVGNALTVQTHFDLSQNIACVVSGKRRFTLFPPEQIANLYMGPMENTLAGTPVSMVRLEDVDYEQFPRFKEAEKHALSTELAPGDALFIPYFWWHHVQSLENFNILVNYWWNEYDALGSPMDTMLHAVLTLRDLPPPMRSAWKAVFDHYIFNNTETTSEHIPPSVRGGLGKIEGPMRIQLWAALATGVGRYAQFMMNKMRRP